MSKNFIDDGNGNVAGVETVEVTWEKVDGKWNMAERPGSLKRWDADLVLLSMGFVSPEHYVSDSAGIELDDRGNYRAEYGKYTTNRDKVFTAGDCRRGQSLVVWAINEGREAAREIDLFLMGDSVL